MAKFLRSEKKNNFEVEEAWKRNEEFGESLLTSTGGIFTTTGFCEDIWVVPAENLPLYLTWQEAV